MTLDSERERVECERRLKTPNKSDQCLQTDHAPPVLIGEVGRKVGWLGVIKDTFSSSPSPCGAGDSRLGASPGWTGSAGDGLVGNDQSLW